MNHKHFPPHVKLGIRITAGVACLGLVYLSGVYTGYQNRPAMSQVTDLVHKESPLTADTDFDAFWRAWQILDQKFPGSDKVSAKNRMYGAIKGLAGSFGDPYTTFFPPADNVGFETQIAGGFSGIGAEIGKKDGLLTVIAPLKGTPADRAGLKPGDKIIKIDKKITTDIDVDQAINLIRGEEGTTVSLTILRQGFAAPKVFDIKREQITLPTVKTESRADKKAFVIHLYNFSAQSTDLFKKGLDEYLASGYTNLLLDLRGNPGGYIDAADAIGSWFLPQGEVIVKEIGKTPADIVTHTSTGPTLFPKGHKLIILADKGSASASEILSGALSEQGIGKLVGTQTFGKGSVQEVIKLTPDTSLKVTVAKWYTPHGISISETGLTPSTVIEQPATATTDIQLEKALDLFK